MDCKPRRLSPGERIDGAGTRYSARRTGAGSRRRTPRVRDHCPRLPVCALVTFAPSSLCGTRPPSRSVHCRARGAVWPRICYATSSASPCAPHRGHDRSLRPRRPPFAARGDGGEAAASKLASTTSSIEAPTPDAAGSWVSYNWRPGPPGPSANLPRMRALTRHAASLGSGGAQRHSRPQSSRTDVTIHRPGAAAAPGHHPAPRYSEPRAARGKPGAQAGGEQASLCTLPATSQPFLSSGLHAQALHAVTAPSAQEDRQIQPVESVLASEPIGRRLNRAIRQPCPCPTRLRRRQAAPRPWPQPGRSERQARLWATIRS